MQVVAEGTPADQARSQVQKIYLGIKRICRLMEVEDIHTYYEDVTFQVHCRQDNTTFVGLATEQARYPDPIRYRFTPLAKENHV
jgi:hypothetical protein